MPTSPTDPVLLIFTDGGGWLRLAGDGAVLRGAGDVPAPEPGEAVVLAVPGSDVAVHWLELDDGLTPAQAVAAARLMLADRVASPLADLHGAAGRAEAGRTPVALVPAARMAQWLAGAQAMGLDPDAIVPAPFLLVAPDEGFARHGDDYRAAGAAFTLEPELAGALVAGAPVIELDGPGFEAGLAAAIADPAVNLRQGPFARRTRWVSDGGWARRMAALAFVLVALILLAQVVDIVRHNRAAARLEAEAAAIAAPAVSSGPRAFGGAAAILFEAIRATPNAELARMEYRPDGSFTLSVHADSPATLAALRGRIEAGGHTVEQGAAGSAGGRPATDLIVRPS